MALLVSQITDFTNDHVDFVSVDALGDTFVNTGNEMVIIKTGETPTTVTIASPTQCSQGFTHDITIELEAEVEKVFPALSVNRFNNSNGIAKVTCNPVTDVTIAVVRI